MFDFFKTERSVNINNVSIQRIISKMKEWKTDTIIISTSHQCPHCKVYNRKVYSLYGWNKNYPKLPDSLKERKCPQCNKIIGAAIYFDGISTKPE